MVLFFADHIRTRRRLQTLTDGRAARVISINNFKLTVSFSHRLFRLIKIYERALFLYLYASYNIIIYTRIYRFVKTHAFNVCTCKNYNNISCSGNRNRKSCDFHRLFIRAVRNFLNYIINNFVYYLCTKLFRLKIVIFIVHLL